MLLLPRTPNRNEPIIDWAREVTAYLRAITPLAGRGTRLDRTANGTRIHSSGGAGGGGGGAGGSSYVDNGLFRIYSYVNDDDETRRSFEHCVYSVGGLVKEVLEDDTPDIEDLLSTEAPPEEYLYNAADNPYVILKVVTRPTSQSGAGSLGYATIEGLKKWDEDDSCVPDATGDDVIALSKNTGFYVRPLYKLAHDGSIAIDYRNMPDLSAMEF